MAKQYTKEETEYWTLLAKVIGNSLPEVEDDSEFVDEDCVVIK